METTAMTEMMDMLSFEASQLWDFMARLGQDGWSRPSACTGWTVGDVLAHLTQGASAWCATITRAVAGDANPPPGEQMLRPGERGSEVTAQRAIAFRQGMGETELLNAFADGYQGLDHGVGHPSCLCTRPKYLSTGGKECARTLVSCGVAKSGRPSDRSRYQRLQAVLLGLQPGDWDKPCYHRRGILPTRDYVGLRLQGLTIHGWDIRSAFNKAATLSERPLQALLGVAQWWLSNTFRPVPHLAVPIRYRFDVPGPVPVRHDVLVSQDSFQREPLTDRGADVTFRCTTGDYLLFVYGRLRLDQAVDTGRLEVEGNRQQAALFTTLF